jgi:protein-tyrosine-phosphatase
MDQNPFQLVFVCVSNRGRSVFAEFFFRKLIGEQNDGLLDRIKVSSAGFIPQPLKDHVAELHIGFPTPFYNRPMPEATRSFLSERGIVVPPDWRSRELTSAMVQQADLIITAIPQQKEDLLKLYPEAAAEIFTIREISRWDGYLRFEDFSNLPRDKTYWSYVEEDADYVATILSEMEERVTLAVPHILKELDLVTIRKLA